MSDFNSQNPNGNESLDTQEPDTKQHQEEKDNIEVDVIDSDDTYKFSMFSHRAVPFNEVEPILNLQSELKMPIWSIIQPPGSSFFNSISPELYGLFFEYRHFISGEEAALLLDTLGGCPHSAYRIINLFKRRVKKLIIIIPLRAKSAGTLMALGADEIILGRDAELGPLDAQIYDGEREK